MVACVTLRPLVKAVWFGCACANFRFFSQDDLHLQIPKIISIDIP